MKTRPSPAFAATLAACGLTSAEWRMLTSHWSQRRTRWVRQTVKRIQRVHSGKGQWWRGVYVTRKEKG